MKRILQIITVTLFTIIFIASCDENESFSSDPSLKLTYSRDTVYFDTVFTTLASPIQRIKISNKNSKSISIDAIELMNPGKSGFRINVNGEAGTVFKNKDLVKGDSIFIFIDIKSPPITNKNSLIEDSIKLSWNGNTQYILLAARGINVKIWDDKIIDKDTQLTANTNYYIRGAIIVNEGARLNIEEGVNLYFDKSGSLNVNGAIEAKGSLKKPITFRSHRFDYADAKVLYDNVSGQWIGVTIGANSYNNLFKNVRIRNARYGLDFLPSNTQQKKATLENTIVHNMSDYGVKAVNCNIEATNCQFSNSKGSSLNLIGGNYNFLHCTIANYYQWFPRTTNAMILEDVIDNSIYPLKAYFTNSIIVGTFKDELGRYYDSTRSSSIFANCVIQSSISEDSGDFVSTQWNIGSAFSFAQLNEEGNFIYSFGLTENSPARDKAYVTAAQQSPADLNGKSRLADGKPDIGCYEWVQ